MAAEKSTPLMSEDEISILKETLCEQQQLLQKLYNELDAEREAAATSASEALSVILRLQGEKSAVKMEAEQYKRMAEEKMCHAEESFAIIEDIIYQKEMEVAALDYQVQSYKYKLLSMGCSDLGGGEIKYPDNLLQRGESLTETCKRNSSSTPNILNKYKKALVDRDRSLSPEPDFKNNNAAEQEINDFTSELDKRAADVSVHGGIAAYMTEIRRLDTRVKSIAGPNYTSTTVSRSGSRPPSPRPAGNSSNPFVANEVHDVFEVPQVDEKRSTADEAFDVAGKDEPDWLKKLFQSTSNEKNLCKPSHIAAMDRGVVQVHAHAQPAAAAVSRPAIFNLRNEIWGTSEIERASESSLREEEVKLMKEVKEELNLLKEEIFRSRMLKRSSARQEECLRTSLPEAMLHFWL